MSWTWKYIGCFAVALGMAFTHSIHAQSSKLQRAVENKNVLIHFWGKVIDHEGNPLAEVKVTATIRGWRITGGGFASSYPTMTATTGADGRFEIDGGTGDVLTLKTLEKEGYEPEPMALRSYGFNISTNINVNADAPIVLRMWKTGDRQQLINGDKLFGIIPDGRVYTIDLLQGTKIESATAEGDLRVKITRPLDVKFGDRYDWSCEIEAINGGLVEEPDRYADMFLAPAADYTNVCRVAVEKSDEHWSYIMPRCFYGKTRDGTYSRIKLEIYAFYDLNKKNGAIAITYATNPSGSRVLR